MAPGVNDGQKNTGTLPKSNRKYYRNRDHFYGIQQQQSGQSSVFRSRPPNSNNLFDSQSGSDKDSIRSVKNSNTRPTSSSSSSVPPTIYQDLSDIVSLSRNRQQSNTYWHEMAQPIDSRAHSPLHPHGNKPNNVDRMPDKRQVEARLNQIRDYIRVTTTMIESLSQSSDPRARTQHEKLSKMVEDLGDSESKLSKLLENYRGLPEEPHDYYSNRMMYFDELLDILNSQEHFLMTNINQKNGEDGEEPLEAQLRKKMEISERKLAELQEHQANLIGMQSRVRERLNEARQAQQLLLLQENQASNISSSTWENENRSQHSMSSDAETLDSEHVALREKYISLNNKKKNVDSLVAELKAIEEESDRVTANSENARSNGTDKAAELKILKEQLAHLKGLMKEAMGSSSRDNVNSTSEVDNDSIRSNTAVENGDSNADDEAGGFGVNNSCDRNSEIDETYAKFNNTKEPLSVEQIQAVTRELKEQQALLLSARAELQRLKNPATPVVLLQGSTPPHSTTGNCGEKKMTNNSSSNNSNHSNNMGGETLQEKRRQLEDLVRKVQSSQEGGSGGGGGGGGSDWDSRRGSNSQLSNSSTPGNIWQNHNVVASGSNAQSAENLLDIGPQITNLENGFANNWWNAPAPPVVQTQQPAGVGSIEYYRQLLMGSQAQQLQMMNTTMQQCFQLLWNQQRELQSMKTTITQIQEQLRQNQTQSNQDNQDYSNLTRSTHHLGNTLDAALPPSSSLPNLVSLPNSTATHTPVVAASNLHQHNQQQLNNQVPPGNRANNYWDNFRSYSRQNLLSGHSKTVTDSLPGPSGNSSLSSIVHTTLVDKRNREQSDNLSLPSVSSSDAQYSPNLAQEREITAARNNILSNETSQQHQHVENFWEDNSTLRLQENNEHIYSLRHLSEEMRDVFVSLVQANRRRPDYLVVILREIKAISEDEDLRPRLLRSLRALQDNQPSNNPLNETADQTASESCQSSDDDSDGGARAASPLMQVNNADQQSLLNEFLMPIHSSIQVPQSMPALLVDHFDFEGAAQMDEVRTIPSASSITPGYYEDLAEADQTRPETTSNNNQQYSSDDETEDNDLHLVRVENSSVFSEADREVDVEDGNDAGLRFIRIGRTNRGPWIVE